MYNIKKFFLLLLVSIVHISLFSQNITGKVVDEESEPLIGVTVRIQGEKGGTVTDLDGNFSIKSSTENPTLVFTYVGMKTKKVKYRGQKKLTVEMISDTNMLDEVVAVGYATMKRKDLTGAVSSVRAKELEDVPVADVTQALAGRIAGVHVTQSSGSPDATITVRVRGGVSITQDNTPLYIIDGIPSDEGLSGLSASDIESIDVLKDASATAVYGSRGANGVIIVTTKGGKAEKVKITYEMYYGMKKMVNRLDVLDADDYARLEYERVGDLGTLYNRYGLFSELSTNFYRRGVNWQELVFGESVSTQMHRINVSGGNKASNFLVSYTRNEDEGIMARSGVTNNSLRLKYAYAVSKDINFDIMVNYMDKETSGSGSLENSKSILSTFLTYRPVGGLDISDEEFTGMGEDPFDPDADPDWRNPFVTAQTEERKRDDQSIQFGANFSWKIMDFLTWRSTISYKKRHMRTTYFAESDHPNAIRESGPYGNISDSFYDNTVLSNTLSYSQKIRKKHNVTFLLGQEYIYNSAFSQSFGARRFPDTNFGLDDLGLAAESTKANSSRSSEKQLSFFLRGDYQLMGRYLFTGVVRADGSSKFGKDNKWGVFPSMSAAWRISEENFMKRFKNITQMKMRFSYGAVGNSRIGNYRSLDLMQRVVIPVADDVKSGYISTLANPDLKWETNITANIGFDLGLFRNRLLLTVDVYNTSTKDLLLERELPYFTGFASCLINVGATRSRGVELSLNTANINTKDFSWNSVFNISFNKTIVRSLAGTDMIMAQSGWGKGQGDGDYMVKVGEQIGLMYGYVGDGIYKVSDFIYDMSQPNSDDRWIIKDKDDNGNIIPKMSDVKLKPGMVRFRDINNDGIISSADRTVIGNAQPLFFGGLNNTFTYKGFDLSVFMNFTVGNDVYNATRMSASNMALENRNVLQSAYEGRFITIDENGESLMHNPIKLAEINKNNNKPAYYGRGTNDFYDEYVEDGSFLRIGNISLGYTFPTSWMKKIYVSKFRIYASVYNLYTITKYSGYDPEVSVITSSNKKGGLTPGLDWGALPRARSVVFGASLTF